VIRTDSAYGSIATELRCPRYWLPIHTKNYLPLADQRFDPTIRKSGDESCSNPRNDGVCSFCRSDHNRHAGYRFRKVLWRVRWMVCKAFKGPGSVPTEVRSKALHLTRSRYGPNSAPKKISGRVWARRGAGARLFLFRGRAGTTLGGELADTRRGAAAGGELCQAAGDAARTFADKRGVTSCSRTFTTVRAMSA